MASVFLVILLVEVAIAVVNAAGAQAINTILWTLLSFLPLESSKLAAQRRKVQTDYLQVRRELNATSGQDEFAKWAKLRRQHDKLLEQLEKIKQALEAARSRFDASISALRFILIRAPQFILPIWYSGQPVFWLPHGLFPWALEWLISFPKAPLGSVSPASWQVACAITLGLIGEASTSLFPRKGDPRLAQPAGPQTTDAGTAAKKES